MTELGEAINSNQLSNRVNVLLIMPWYVICIKPKYEKIVVAFLQKRGVDYYCPMIETVRQWSDRKKKIQIPLFSSYMFVNLQDYAKETANVLRLPGVLRFLWHSGKACIVRNEEIDEIKNFLNKYKGLKPQLHFFPGQTVEISKGVLVGHKGQIKGISGNKAYLILNSMGCYFTCEVPLNMLLVSS